MRIAVILFPLFSFVQGVLDIGADNIRRISVYAACLRLKPSNDFAKKAVHLVRNILSNYPRPTAFCWPILKNPDLQLE
jgi:hypothetical protein